MKKRFLIVFALCALLLSLPASAESTGTCGANLTWRLDDSGMLTISGTGDMTEYDTWSNATVPWGRSVTKVSILEGVTSIGREAFNYCGSLTEITIPATVSRIGACAFYYCDSLPEVTIPNSVKTICEYAFYACGSLETIVLPDSVTVVEYGAFLDCGSLTSAVMGNSVISIGGNAFYHCAKLTSVTIPNPDTVIGQDAFLGCGSDLTIRCKAGSKAQEYAEANGIRVELIVTRPVITRQPISVSVMEGNTAVFQATATDAETYRWYYRKSSTASWTPVRNNGDSATYALATAARHNGYQYYCLVSNSAGSEKTTTVTLTVNSKPVITTQPESVSVAVGETAVFKVTANGALSYQWYYQKPGENTWNEVTRNGRSASCMLTAAARHNGYKYRCKLTNNVGDVYSDAVTLSVK